ncbi:MULTISPECIES: PLP-dependent aminotransferase family protein [Roseobacteraceae]|uniref:MocR-like pyridoxine biosynthesis transcription factor PdxR n=1 Tax=Roseobacteraceae TaxID=2854170 RepID=UPI003297DAA1
MLNARFLTLPKSSTLGLRDQVCELISAAIAQDLFPKDTALPSCRALSVHLGVSRNTVYDAYCRLINIGLVTSRDRSGYFVDDTTAAQNRALAVSTGPETSTPSPLKTAMQGRKRPSDMAKVDHPDDWSTFSYPFVYNQIDPTWFPIQEWRESMRAAMATSELGGWSRDAGGADSPYLIKQLQQRLLGYRGINAGTDEILITSGAQNAISILATLNAYVGRSVALEDPCYPEARNAFEIAGNQMHFIPVDQSGLEVDKIPKGVGLVYTTPSHQFPTTVTMPVDRRLELCARAVRDDFLICEDDYEAEMNFVQKRGHPIRSLDTSGRTVYVGSLSKSVAPGLRIGYMVAHPDVVREAKAIRRSIMRHPPILLQDAMAHFIASGALDAHLRRMERRYKSRWEIVLTALTEHMPQFDLQVSQGGTCVWLTGPAHIDTTRLAKRLRKRSVLIDEGSAFYSDPSQGRRKLRIGFAALSRNAIRDGIQIIADEVKLAGT